MKNIVNTSIVYGFNSRLLHWKNPLADTRIACICKGFFFFIYHTDYK